MHNSTQFHLCCLLHPFTAKPISRHRNWNKNSIQYMTASSGSYNLQINASSNSYSLTGESMYASRINTAATTELWETHQAQKCISQAVYTNISILVKAHVRKWHFACTAKKHWSELFRFINAEYFTWMVGPMKVHVSILCTMESWSTFI